MALTVRDILDADPGFGTVVLLEPLRRHEGRLKQAFAAHLADLTTE